MWGFWATLRPDVEVTSQECHRRLFEEVNLKVKSSALDSQFLLELRHIAGSFSQNSVSRCDRIQKTASASADGCGGRVMRFHTILELAKRAVKVVRGLIRRKIELDSVTDVVGWSAPRSFLVC